MTFDVRGSLGGLGTSESPSSLRVTIGGDGTGGQLRVQWGERFIDVLTLRKGNQVLDVSRLHDHDLNEIASNIHELFSDEIRQSLCKNTLLTGFTNKPEYLGREHATTQRFSQNPAQVAVLLNNIYRKVIEAASRPNGFRGDGDSLGGRVRPRVRSDSLASADMLTDVATDRIEANAALQQAYQQIAALQAQLAQSQSQIRSLQERDLRDSKDISELRRLQTANDELQGNLRAAMANAATANERVGALTQENDRLQAENARLAQLLGASQRVQAELSATNARQAATIERLQAAFSQAHDELGAARSQNERARAELDRLRGELQAAQRNQLNPDEIAHLQDQLAAAQDDARSAREELAAARRDFDRERGGLEQAVREAQAETATAQREREAAQARERQLQDELRQATATLRSKEEALEAAQRELQSLGVRLQAAVAHVASLQGQLTGLEHVHAGEQAVLEQQLATSESARRRLETELAEALARARSIIGTGTPSISPRSPRSDGTGGSTVTAASRSESDGGISDESSASLLSQALSQIQDELERSKNLGRDLEAARGGLANSQRAEQVAVDKVRRANERLADLERELAAAQQENEGLSSQVGDLSARLATTRAELTQGKAEEARLKKMIDELRSSDELFPTLAEGQELGRAKREGIDRQQRLEQLEDRLDRIRRNNHDLNQRAVSVERALAQALAQNQALMDQLSQQEATHRSQLNEAQASLAQAQHELAGSRISGSELQQQNTQLASRLVALGRDLDEARRAADEVQINLTQAQEEHRAQQAELRQQLTTVTDERDQAITTLTTAREEHALALRGLQDQVAQGQSRIEALSLENDQLRALQREAQTQLASLERTQRGFSRQIAKLESQTAGLQEAVVAAEKALPGDPTDAAYAAAWDQLRGAHQALTDHLSHIAALQEALVGLGEEVTSAHEALEKARAAGRAFGARFAGELQRLQQAHSDARATLDTRDSELLEARQATRQVSKELTASREEVARLQQKIEADARIIQEQSGRIEALTQQLAVSQSDLQGSEATVRALRAELAKGELEQARLQRVITELMHSEGTFPTLADGQELGRAKQDRIDRQQRLEQLEDRLDRIRTNNHALNERAKRAERDLQQAQAENQELRDQLRQQEAEHRSQLQDQAALLDQARGQNAQLLDRVAALETSVADYHELEQRLRAAQASIASLEPQAAENVTAQQELSQLRASAARQERELANLRSQIQRIHAGLQGAGVMPSPDTPAGSAAVSDQAALAAIQSAIDDFRRKSAQYESTTQSQEARLSQLQQLLQGIQRENSQLVDELAGANQALRSLNDQLSEAREAASEEGIRLNGQMAALQARVRDLEAQKQASDAKVQARLEEILKALGEAQVTLPDGLADRLRSLQDRPSELISLLLDQLRDNQTALASGKQQLDALQVELAASKAAQGRVQALAKELDAARSRNSELETKHAGEKHRAEDRIRTLEQQLNAANRQKEAADTRLSLLLQQLADNSSLPLDLKRSIELFQRKLGKPDLQQDEAGFQALLTALTGGIGQSYAELERKGRLLDAAQQENRELQSEVASQQSQQTAALAEQARALALQQAENRRLQEQVGQLSARLQQLLGVERKAKQLEERLDDLQTNSEANLAAIERLTQEKEEVREEANGLRLQMQLLRSSLASQGVTLHGDSGSTEGMLAAFFALKSQLAQSTREKDAQSDVIARLSRQLEDQTNEIASLKHQYDLSQERLQQSYQQLDLLKAEGRNAKDRYEDNLEELNERIDQLTREQAGLLRQMQTLAKGTLEQFQALGSSEPFHGSLRAMQEAADFEGVIQGLAGFLGMATGQLTARSYDLQQLSIQNQYQQAELNSQTALLSSQSQELATLRSVNAQLRDQLSERQAALEASQGETASLRESLAKAQEEARQAGAKVSSIRSALGKEVEEGQESAAIARLKKELEVALAAQTEAQLKATSLEQQLQASQREVASLRERLAVSQRDLASAKQENQEQLAELRQLRETLSSVQRENASFGEKLDAAQKRLTAFEEKVGSPQAGERDKQQLALAQKEVAWLKAQLLSHQSTLAHLRSSLLGMSRAGASPAAYAKRLLGQMQGAVSELQGKADAHILDEIGALSSQMDELRQKASTLEDELASARATRLRQLDEDAYTAELDKRIANLERELLEFDQAIEGIATQFMRQLSSLLEGEDADLATLVSAILNKGLQGDVSAIDEQLKAAQRELGSKSNDLQEALSENRKLMRNLETSEREREALLRNNQSLAGKLEASQRRVDELGELERTIQELMARFNPDGSHALERAQSAILLQGLQTRLAHLEGAQEEASQLKIKNQSLSEKIRELSELSREKEDLQARAGALQEALGKAEEKTGEQAEELAQLNSKLDTAQVQLTQKEQELDLAVAIALGLEEGMQKLLTPDEVGRRVADQLAKAIEEAAGPIRQRLEIVQREKADVELELTSVRSQLDSAHARAKVSESMAEELRKANQSLMTHNDSLIKENDELHAQAKQQEGQLAMQAERLKKMLELAKRVATYEVSERKYAEQEAIVQRLREELQEATQASQTGKAKLQKLEGQLNAAMKMQARMREELASVQRENEQIKTYVRTMGEGVRRLGIPLGDDMTAQGMVKSLTELLAAVEKTRKAQAQEDERLKQLDARLTYGKSEYEAAKRRVTQLEQACKRATEEREALLQQLQAAKTPVVDTKKLQEAEAKVKTLEGQLADQRQALGESTSKFADLTRQLDLQRALHQEAVSKNEKLLAAMQIVSQERDSLRQRVRSLERTEQATLSLRASLLQAESERDRAVRDLALANITIQHQADQLARFNQTTIIEVKQEQLVNIRELLAAIKKLPQPSTSPRASDQEFQISEVPPALLAQSVTSLSLNLDDPVFLHLHGIEDVQRDVIQPIANLLKKGLLAKVPSTGLSQPVKGVLMNMMLFVANHAPEDSVLDLARASIVKWPVDKDLAARRQLVLAALSPTPGAISESLATQIRLAEVISYLKKTDGSCDLNKIKIFCQRDYESGSVHQAIKAALETHLEVLATQPTELKLTQRFLNIRSEGPGVITLADFYKAGMATMRSHIAFLQSAGSHLPVGSLIEQIEGKIKEGFDQVLAHINVAAVSRVDQSFVDPQAFKSAQIETRSVISGIEGILNKSSSHLDPDMIQRLNELTQDTLISLLRSLGFADDHPQALIEYISEHGALPSALNKFLSARFSQDENDSLLLVAQLAYLSRAFSDKFKARFGRVASLDDLAWICDSKDPDEKARALFKFIQIAYKDDKLKGSPLAHIQARWGESVKKLFESQRPDDIYAQGGSGKTTTVKFFLKQLQDQYPSKRILFLSPIAFAKGELGDASRIHGAMLDKRSGQSVYQVPDGWDPEDVIVVVDEAHLLAPDCDLILQGGGKTKEVGAQFLRMTATPITSGLDVTDSLEVVSNTLTERLDEISFVERAVQLELSAIEKANQEQRDVAVVQSLLVALSSQKSPTLAKLKGNDSDATQAFTKLGQILGTTIPVLHSVPDVEGHRQEQWAKKLQEICTKLGSFDAKCKEIAIHLAKAGHLTSKGNYFNHEHFQKAMLTAMEKKEIGLQKPLSWRSVLILAFGDPRGDNLQKEWLEKGLPSLDLGVSSTEEHASDLRAKIEVFKSMKMALEARLESVKRLQRQDQNSDRRELFENTARHREELLGPVASSDSSPRATIPGYAKADLASVESAIVEKVPTAMQVKASDGTGDVAIFNVSLPGQLGEMSDRAFLAVHDTIRQLENPCTRAQVIFPGVKLTIAQIKDFKWQEMSMPTHKDSSELLVHVIFHNSDQTHPDYGKDMVLSPDGTLKVLDPAFDRAGKFLIMLYDDTNKQGGDFGALSEVLPVDEGAPLDDIAQFIFLNVHDDDHPIPEQVASESDMYQAICRRRGVRHGLAPQVYSTRPASELREQLHAKQAHFERQWAKRDLIEVVKERLMRAHVIASALAEQEGLGDLKGVVGDLTLQLRSEQVEPTSLQAVASRVDQYCRHQLSHFTTSETQAAAAPAKTAATAPAKTASVTHRRAAPASSELMFEALMRTVSWDDPLRKGDFQETVYSSLVEVANVVKEVNKLLDRNKELLAT